MLLVLDHHSILTLIKHVQVTKRKKQKQLSDTILRPAVADNPGPDSQDRPRADHEQAQALQDVQKDELEQEEQKDQKKQ
jgi:hypothetical protein